MYPFSEGDTFTTFQNIVESATREINFLDNEYVWSCPGFVDGLVKSGDGQETPSRIGIIAEFIPYSNKFPYPPIGL